MSVPIIRSTVDASRLAQAHRELDILRAENASLRQALATVCGMAEDGRSAESRKALMPKIANFSRAALGGGS